MIEPRFIALREHDAEEVPTCIANDLSRPAASGKCEQRLRPAVRQHEAVAGGIAAFAQREISGISDYMDVVPARPCLSGCANAGQAAMYEDADRRVRMEH